MVSTTDRIAWLLRCNRLLGADRGWAQAKRFAAAFRGGVWPTAANESRISRWETGVVRPPTAAVSRYEELLCLPPGTLTSTVDILHRYAAGRAAAVPVVDRRPLSPAGAESSDGGESPAGAQRLDELLDRALSTDLMSGAHWDELSGLVGARPGLVLTPRAARARLAERLVSEMIIANDLPWRQRFEALNRLLEHPSCGPAAVAACAGLGADRDNQIFVEIISVLDASRHPDASRSVLAQLADPTNDRALAGALLACERKIRCGHFAPHQLSVVAGTVRDLLVDPTHGDDARVLAVLLARRGHRFPGLGPTAGGSAGATVPDAVSASVVGRGGPALSPRESATATRIAHATVVRLAADFSPTLGGTLARLVAELLFHPLSDARLYAAMLVAATPFRTPLARVLATELDPARSERLAANLRLLTALRVLGGATERPVVEGIVTAPRLPPDLVRMACFTVGHLTGSSDRRFWEQALRRHLGSWTRTRDAAAFAAVTGLIYSLGISGQRGFLRDLRDTPGLPDPARRAATWWLDLPEHVHRSAVR